MRCQEHSQWSIHRDEFDTLWASGDAQTRRFTPSELPHCSIALGGFWNSGTAPVDDVYRYRVNCTEVVVYKYDSSINPDYSDTRLSCSTLPGDAPETQWHGFYRTLQLAYISAVKLVARETWILCTGMQPIKTVSLFLYSRHSWDSKHSSVDEVTAGYRSTCGNRSVVAASAGSKTRVQQALNDSSYQPWPWSGLEVTMVNLLWSLGVMRTQDRTRDRYPFTIVEPVEKFQRLIKNCGCIPGSNLEPWEYGVVDAMRLGAWLRYKEVIGWLAAGTTLHQTLSIERLLLVCFWHVLFVIVPFFLSFLSCFCFVFVFWIMLKTSDLPVALFAFFKSLNQTFWLYRYIFLYVFPLAFTYITSKSIIDTIWFMRCTHGLAIF